MRSFLIKRILQAVSVVVCISALTFFVLNIVPGDPVRVMMGDMADEATVQQVRHTMGLDKPIPEQYANWFVKMLGGDFGTSYTQKRPVIALLTKALGVTLRLAVFAYLFAIVLGLLMGILAAVNHGKWLDRTLMSAAIFGISASLSVSSSTILASVTISLSVKPACLAFSLRSKFQNFLFSSLILSRNLSTEVFQ